VNGTHDTSTDLVDEVSTKACEFNMEFTDPVTGNSYYHGQGGFIRGTVLATRTRPDDDDGRPEPKRARVAFQEDMNDEATPMTAQHNLKSHGEEIYLRTTVKCYDQVEKRRYTPRRWLHNGGENSSSTRHGCKKRIDLEC